MKTNTFIIPIIRTDLIERCLYTLYKNTPHNFYVYVIDQSKHGIDRDIIDKYIHLYIRPYRNLGFAKATNEGIKLVETKYFTMCNDDVEFMDKRWWKGVTDTFDKVNRETPEKPAVLVNPASAKLPDWSVGAPKGDDHYILPYRTVYSKEEYDHLLNDEHYINKYLTIKPDTVIDGVTMYCSVCDTEKFKEISMLNELFYPGGAEDYDWNARANMQGYRCVGTTLSWVFHHWSKSFKSITEKEDMQSLVDDSLRFGSHTEIWGKDFDVWGSKGDAPPITNIPL